MINNKLLLFGGKGGVGKTSCAAATALYAASKGKKTLILSTDPAHSLSDSFEKEIGNKMTNIKDNLDALEIDSNDLLKEYKTKNGELIKQIANEGTFFSKEDIQRFFDLSLPGIDELIALIQIMDILEQGKYDLLVLDTAPTGHTIRLLEMPQLMESYVRVLAEMRQKHRVVVSMMVGRYMRDKADEFINKMDRQTKKIKELLRSRYTKFIPITIPEAMSINETERLVKVLEEHEIPIEEILINGVIDENCSFCKSKKLEQQGYIKEIKEKFSKYEINEIPLFANEIKGKNLEILSKILFDEEYKLPKPAVKDSAEVKFDSLKLKESLEFLLFGGKGGVGKTSCAAASALHLSKNKKVLLFSTDPAHSLSDSLGIKISRSITKVNDNLDALEIDAYSLLNNLKIKYKKEINDFFNSVLKPTTSATIDAPYDRAVMRDLFDLAPPGIDEIMALKEMIDLMQDKKYDLLILDTAPTGHTIRLLELPEKAEQWARTLLEILEQYPISFDVGDSLNEILETINKIREILSNPEKTSFVIVAIPEAMSLFETKDLFGSLKKLKVPVEYLIINKIIPKNNCNFCSAKRSEQLSYLEKFKGLKLKMVGVELFDKEVKGEDLNRVMKTLFKGVS